MKFDSEEESQIDRARDGFMDVHNGSVVWMKYPVL